MDETPDPEAWSLTWPQPCRAGQSISLPDSGAGSGSSLGPECPLWLRSSRPQHGSSAPSAGGHLTTSGAAGGRETQIYWYKPKRLILTAEVNVVLDVMKSFGIYVSLLFTLL